MSTITVNISEDQIQWLAELAKRFSIPLEDLLRASFEEFVSCPPEDFEKALEYVLKKNKVLYNKWA